MEPVNSGAELVIRYWREVLIICLFFWGQSKNSEIRHQKKLRIKKMYEYESCREIIPKDKIFMWPTRYFDPQKGTYTLQTLQTEEQLLSDVLRD